MATTAMTQVDRERIKELTERELHRLNDRTPGSQEMYERARQTLSGGVASSYQVRDPWPIYLSHGKGAAGLGRRRQRHARLPQRLRLDGAGPRASGDLEGRPGARRARHPLRRADRGRRRSSARSSPGASACPRWRYVNSGSEATMDAIRIARALTGRDTIVKIFGSYHGHHDYVMVSIGVPYDKIGDRENYASLPYGGGIPQAVGRDDHRRAVQRRRGDGAPHRAPRPPRAGSRPA